MTWGAIGSAAVMTVGGKLLGGGSKQTGTQTVTQQQQMDPRIAGMLFGQGDTQGLLSQYQGMLGRPQNAGINQYGLNMDAYLGGNAATDVNTMRNAAYNQLGRPGAPNMQAAQINAPSQNALDLTSSYNRFINQDPGANPYLTNAIQGGINQSTNQFRQMQDEATQNLMRNVMPGIRSNAVLTGQYGGSRQGVGEANAISDFTRQQQQAATQFGQGNTNAAVGAQAQAYGQGMDRALAATQGLGAQQYGVAGQNAALEQAANQANLQSQLGSNALNAQVQQQGIGNLGGLMNNAYGVGQAQDAYTLNQAKGVNSLLGPYLGQVPGGSTTSQPLYQNTAGNILGGVTAGLGLGQKLGGLLSGYTGGTDTSNYPLGGMGL